MGMAKTKPYIKVTLLGGWGGGERRLGGFLVVAIIILLNPSVLAVTNYLGFLHTRHSKEASNYLFIHFYALLVIIPLAPTMLLLLSVKKKSRSRLFHPMKRK